MFKGIGLRMDIEILNNIGNCKIRGNKVLKF